MEPTAVAAPWVVAASAVLALAAVASPRAWRVSRGLITIAHEGGHALAALLTRRRLAGIRLHSDASGVTVSSGRPDGPEMIVTTAAGYVAPALAGLAFAVTLAAGHATALLWTSIAGLAAMLLAIRNVYGAVSVVGSGAAIFGVAWFAPPVVQAGFAYLVTWFLLLASTRPVLELQRLRRRGRAPHSDADQLARLTGLPAAGWVFVFAAVTLGALMSGGWLLMEPVTADLETFWRRHTPPA